MRTIMLMLLLGVLLAGMPVWAQQAGEKASEAAPAGAAPVEEAESAEQAQEAAPAEEPAEKPAEDPKEPGVEVAPNVDAIETEGGEVVLEREGTGPVAAFWFVVPERS